jgi:hypothetical protein
MSTPVQAVVGGRNGRITLREYEHTFPAQRGTKVWMIRIEAFGIAKHRQPQGFKVSEFQGFKAKVSKFQSFKVSGFPYLETLKP